MSAPLQNHSLNGSIDINEHPVGTWSSRGTLKGDEGPPVRSMTGGRIGVPRTCCPNPPKTGICPARLQVGNADPHPTGGYPDHKVCIFQGFWASAIFASQILQCFPAFQRFSPEMVSKKARSLSESLKHYKKNSRKDYKTQDAYSNVQGFGTLNEQKCLFLSCLSLTRF